MCRRIFIAFLALSITAPLAAEEPQPATAESEMQQLAGTWEGYAVEDRGERPDRGPVHLRLVIDEGKIRAVDLGSPEKKDMGSGTYKLDPSQKIKQIDATGIILPGKRERTFLGIYEIDGDTFKWCVDNRSKERPTEFRTIGGKYLLILKRQK
ncbi:MAG TPA: TIGR03067 domain-containing protein [Pirellulaceae bacterium]|nr:TIGR03067 domain-containing protein [Pirellulaceae bacterium]